MIVQLKDLKKVFVVSIISFCAVFVTMLFSNFYLDLKALDISNFGIVQKQYYNVQLTVAKFVVIVTLSVLSITSGVILIFYIKKFIDESKQKIGILKALGYSNFVIAKECSIFSISILIGTALGASSTYFIMPKFYESRNKDNILPNISSNFHFELIVYLVIIPTLLFLILILLYVLLRLNVPTTRLLKELQVVKNRKFKVKRYRIKNNFLKELKLTILFSNKTLLFFVLLATMSFSSMFQMAFGMNDFVDSTIQIMMLLIGIVLSFSILLVSLETIIANNKKNILIMSVMGYTHKENLIAVLSGYRIVAYIGFLIGSVYQYVLIRVLLKILAKETENIPQYNFNFWLFTVNLVIFITVYELVMHSYSKKIRKIDIKKVMID